MTFTITISAGSWAEAVGKLMAYLSRLACDPAATDPDVEIQHGGGGGP